MVVNNLFVRIPERVPENDLQEKMEVPEWLFPERICLDIHHPGSCIKSIFDQTAPASGLQNQDFLNRDK